MYTCKNIHLIADSFMHANGFSWQQDELMFGEIPTVYWSGRGVYLRIRLIERQCETEISILKDEGAGLPQHRNDWVNVFTFTDEYQRRLKMTVEELVSQLVVSTSDCLAQLADGLVKLIPILDRAILASLNQKRVNEQSGAVRKPN
ncbi:MAG: hypothetical protein KKH12_13535 [Gammaproteobacteria bacterium]|nr:hypothetical protein [Gammaproteobacteria bacterium]MBU1482680.1 hypothetical protein [Gammaproteobacteria bacterium]